MGECEIKKKYSTLLVGLLLFVNCEKGLDPVEGFEGKIIIPIDSLSGEVIWPDSLKGAVIITAKFQQYSSIDSFFTNLIAFSDPIDTNKNEQSYFIQTLPGIYIVGVAGIKIPISDILFLPRDSLSAHPEYFVPIGLYKLPHSILSFESIKVNENEIERGIDITIDFDIELPF